MADYGYKYKGTAHMVSNSGFEPQRNNNFEVQIIGLEGAKKIMLAVASYSAPQININPITINYANNSIKYAGKPEFPDSTIVLNDYIGLDVEKALSDWQKQVYDPETERIGLAVNYKKTAYLIEYSPDGLSYRQWKLYGCWPSQLQLGEFSQDGNATRQVTLNITYDRAVPQDANLSNEHTVTLSDINGKF
jgi:hypothetical protein